MPATILEVKLLERIELKRAPGQRVTTAHWKSITIIMTVY